MKEQIVINGDRELLLLSLINYKRKLYELIQLHRNTGYQLEEIIDITRLDDMIIQIMKGKI